MDERKAQYLVEERERLLEARKNPPTPEGREELMAQRRSINAREVSIGSVSEPIVPLDVDTPAIRRRSSREEPAAEE